MYDLSGCRPADVAFVQQDWQQLQEQFALFDNKKHPTYLRHRGKPLLSIWGVGFNDKRAYTISDVAGLVVRLKGPENKISILLGVPYYWRTLDRDTEASPELHALIKKVELVMPWAVGRYHAGSYNTAGPVLAGDIQWCKTNNVDYVPLAFPGFSWGNLKNDVTAYNAIPRHQGDFLWQQVAGAKMSGAEALYVAMFDEIDEGTAIFKVAGEGQLPLNGDKKFIGLEPGLASDYYLWLTGQAARWFHGDNNYGPNKPQR